VSETVVIACSLAQRPHHGGHAWALLQYVLGFRQLGWEVLLLDRLEPEMHCDELGRPAPPDRSVNVRYFRDLTASFGVAGNSALLLDGGRTVGLSRSEILRRTRSAAFLLDVMGFLGDDEILAAAPLRVYLDIDPGFPQLWRELGLHDGLGRHDRYVTVGARLGTPECSIPACGLQWLPTLPPVVLEEWPPVPTWELEFTTVAMWRGPYEPIEYGGVRLGLRAHEFRRFASLPTRTAASFEVALEIDPSDTADRDLLASHGWHLVDPRRAAGTPSAYRRFVQRSRAEISVAKGIYVQTRSGWFSDRSACYLASGKPAVVQQTGFDAVLPVGEGLLAFGTLDEAVACVEEVIRAPERHARASRELAIEYFDAPRALRRLLSNLG
jgi:hypothetical protein